MNKKIKVLYSHIIKFLSFIYLILGNISKDEIIIKKTRKLLAKYYKNIFRFNRYIK